MSPVKKIPEINDLVPFGKIAKLQGFTGEVLLQMHPLLTRRISPPEFIFIAFADGIVPYFIEKYEAREDVVLLKLEDVNSGDDAKKLLKTDVLVERKFAGKTGDLDDADPALIIGYTVTDITLGDLGTVTGIDEIPGNPLIRAVKDGAETLIPLNSEIVLKIDRRKKTVLVNVPDGLVGLWV